MKSGCPFCDLSSDRTRIIEHGSHATVIFSDPRLVPGHLLIIPKSHIEKPWELTSAERLEILELAYKYQRKITSGLATGCDLRQNYRPFITQNRLKIDHVHYHLIPREFEDELYQKSMIHEKAIFQDLTSQEVQLILRRLT